MTELSEASEGEGREAGGGVQPGPAVLKLVPPDGEFAGMRQSL